MRCARGRMGLLSRPVVAAGYFAANSCAGGRCSACDCKIQPYCVLSDSGGYDNFDCGNQGISKLQHRSSFCKIDRGSDVHRGRQRLSVEEPASGSCELECLSSSEHRFVWVIWLVRRVAWGGRGIFRVYRLRCSFNGRARSPQAAKRYAYWHSWLPSYLYFSVHRGLWAADSDGALQSLEHWSTGVLSDPGDRREVGKLRGQCRGFSGLKHSNAGDASGTVACFLLDGKRWPVMEMGERHSSTISDTMEVDGDCRIVRCDCWGARAHRRSWAVS